MIQLSRFLTILLAAVLLSACGTLKVGRDFDIGVFAAEVENGVTTQNQVRAWLGEPTSVGLSYSTNGEHYDEWAYYFAEAEMGDMSKTKVKLLQIKFDQQDKVRGYNWSKSR